MPTPVMRKHLIRTNSTPITIRISGAQAELHGTDPEPVLSECLSFLSPNRRFNARFRSGDWDGMVALYEGRQFPAGLATRVVEHLHRKGQDVRVVEVQETKPVDLSRLSPTYIDDPSKPGFALRAHQMGAVEAMLGNVRGIVKAPTGSGKTEMIFVAARYLWEEFGHRSLVVEPKLGLARQTAERFRLYARNEIEIGLFAGGERDTGPIVVATAQTLLGYKPRSRPGKKGRPGRVIAAESVLREVVQDFEVLFFDECHHSSSETWYDIAMSSSALRRYGLSATPVVEDDLRDARLIAATGPIIYEAKSTDMIEQGFAARPKIVVVMSPAASGPSLPMTTVDLTNEKSGVTISKSVPLPYDEAYEQGIIQNRAHNAAVTLATAWLVDHKRQTIVLCRRKDHFTTLAEMFQEAGLNFAAVWGATDNSDRDHAKRAFGAGKINVVLATTIWDEGEDVKNVQAVVLAEGVKVSTNSRQRVGRGMRPDSEEVWVVDFAPTCHPTLLKHAYQRALAYEAEGYEVRVLQEWPEAGSLDWGDELLPFLDWK